MDLKNNRRGRISEYVEKFRFRFLQCRAKRPWSVACDVALPCATQNELDGEHANDPGSEWMYRGSRRSQYAFYT